MHDSPYQILQHHFDCFLSILPCFQVTTGKVQMQTKTLATPRVVLPVVLELELSCWRADSIVRCLSSITLFDLSFGSGPWSQSSSCSFPRLAWEGAGWRIPELSQRLISADNQAAGAQTHSWPPSFWRAGIAFDSSSEDALGLKWIVSAALILKTRLMRLSLCASIQTEFFTSPWVVNDTGCRPGSIRGYTWGALSLGTRKWASNGPGPSKGLENDELSAADVKREADRVDKSTA